MVRPLVGRSAWGWTGPTRSRGHRPGTPGQLEVQAATGLCSTRTPLEKPPAGVYSTALIRAAELLRFHAEGMFGSSGQANRRLRIGGGPPSAVSVHKTSFGRPVREGENRDLLLEVVDFSSLSRTCLIYLGFPSSREGPPLVPWSFMNLPSFSFGIWRLERTSSSLSLRGYVKRYKPKMQCPHAVSRLNVGYGWPAKAPRQFVYCGSGRLPGRRWAWRTPRRGCLPE